MRSFGISLIFLISLARVWAQDPGFQLTIDARNISIYIEVTEESGKPVSGLAKEQFTIYDNGVARPIQAFASNSAPYDIVILVDCSASTKANWPFLETAVRQFSRKLKPQDNMLVAQFGIETSILQNWRAGGEFTKVTIQANDRVCEKTDFYGALQWASKQFKSSNGRRGIIVLSDGQQDPASYQDVDVVGHKESRYLDAKDDGDFQTILKTMSQSDVIVYVVAVNTDLNPDVILIPWVSGLEPKYDTTGIYNPAKIFNMQQARARMQLIADVTGGRVIFPTRPVELNPLYEEIADQLSSSYTLWFSPPDLNDHAVHHIEVRSNVNGLHIKQARLSYIIEY